MATYTITFVFKEEFHFVDFTADQFITSVFSDDSILDFMDNHPEFELDCKFYCGNKQYLVEFTYKNPYKLSIYETEGDQCRVADNIPYCLLRIKDDDTILYDINNYI